MLSPRSPAPWTRSAHRADPERDGRRATSSASPGTLDTMMADPASDAAADLPVESGWFGLDRTGQYAFFTGKGASVPVTVRAVLDAHDALRAAIAVPGVRSPEFPSSYARVGLFVYEWSNEQGAYRRSATPKGAVPSLLRAE